MVDVAPDRDHRWAHGEVLLAILHLEFPHVIFVCLGDNRQRDIEFLSEQLRHLIVQDGIDGQRLAHLHQLADHIGGRLADSLGEFPDGHLAVDRDRLGP